MTPQERHDFRWLIGALEHACEQIEHELFAAGEEEVKQHPVLAAKRRLTRRVAYNLPRIKARHPELERP